MQSCKGRDTMPSDASGSREDLTSPVYNESGSRKRPRSELETPGMSHHRTPQEESIEGFLSLLKGSLYLYVDQDDFVDFCRESLALVQQFKRRCREEHQQQDEPQQAQCVPSTATECGQSEISHMDIPKENKPTIQVPVHMHPSLVGRAPISIRQESISTGQGSISTEQNSTSTGKDSSINLTQQSPPQPMSTENMSSSSQRSSESQNLSGETIEFNTNQHPESIDNSLSSTPLVNTESMAMEAQEVYQEGEEAQDENSLNSESETGQDSMSTGQTSTSTEKDSSAGHCSTMKPPQHPPLSQPNSSENRSNSSQESSESQKQSEEITEMNPSQNSGSINSSLSTLGKTFSELRANTTSLVEALGMAKEAKEVSQKGEEALGENLSSDLEPAKESTSTEKASISKDQGSSMKPPQQPPHPHLNITENVRSDSQGSSESQKAVKEKTELNNKKVQDASQEVEDIQGENPLNLDSETDQNSKNIEQALTYTGQDSAYTGLGPVIDSSKQPSIPLSNSSENRSNSLNNSLNSTLGKNIPEKSPNIISIEEPLSMTMEVQEVHQENEETQDENLLNSDSEKDQDPTMTGHSSKSIEQGSSMKPPKQPLPLQSNSSEVRSSNSKVSLESHERSGDTTELNKPQRLASIYSSLTSTFGKSFLEKSPKTTALVEALGMNTDSQEARQGGEEAQMEKIH